jgi:hypothetical protein
MPRPAGLVVLGLCLSLAGATGVSARPRKKPARVSLEYRKLAGAERCPSRAQLEAQVDEILGRPSFARSARRKVRCVLRGQDGGIAARVQLVDTRSGRVLGVRELSGTGPSCDELGGAVALAIALAIDPLARPPAPPPPPPAPPLAAAGALSVAGSHIDGGTVGAGAAGVASSGSAAGVASAASAAGAGRSGASSSGLAGSVAAGAAAVSAAGSGAAGTSTARPPPAPPSRPPPPPPPPPPPVALVRDAGPSTPLVTVPLVAALVADAGVLAPAVRDAGVASALAPDAGPMGMDAGPAPTADAGAPDAGPAALATDAGVEGPPDAGAASELAEPSAVAAAAPASAGWRPVVGVGAVGTVGTLPGLAGGVLVHAGAASSAASIELEGRWLPGTRTAFGTGSISTSMVSGALVGCARFGDWAACGLAQAGPVSATGQGYSRSEEVSAWMLSVGARGQWEWVFADPIGVRLHLDANANLIRPRLLVDSQAAWTAPPFSVSVGGGLFGRF